MRHFALLLGGVLMCTLPLFAQPGSLDPSFGGDGIVTTALGASDDHGTSMFVQPDGKVVLSGLVFSGFFSTMGAVRYNMDGTLDSAFGDAGRVLTSVGGAQPSAHASALQPDGKIILAGCGSVGFALLRFLPDGTPDSTFGTYGQVHTSILGLDDSIWALEVQPDGNIVAAGYSATGAEYAVALARYHPDGSLDSTFGTNGTMTTAVGDQAFGMGVALQPDGRIVVSTNSFTGFTCEIVLLCLLPDGTLDPAFGINGKVTTNIAAGPDVSEDITVQVDGKIVVVGYSIGSVDFDLAVLRYDPDGTLDNGFGSNGVVVTDMGGDAYGYALTMQPDGRILVGGEVLNGSDYDFALVRYLADGTLDNSFGSNGKVITPVSPAVDGGLAIALQADGRILVGGFANTGPGDDFAVLRYLGGSDIGVADPDTNIADMMVFPNTAADEATLAFSLTVADELTGTLLDVQGRTARILFEGVHSAGPHHVGLDLSGLPPGMYTLSLTSPTSARNLRIIKQ